MLDETLYHYTAPYLLDPLHPITVAVIGAGGTGSQLLTQLGKMHGALRALDHPGLYVTVYDDDTVSEANLFRQMFPAHDLGANKAVSIVTRLNRFFGLQWQAIPERYNGSLHNIIITCVDTAKARIQIAKRIYRKKSYYRDQERCFYWIDAGNNKTRGQVVLATVERITGCNYRDKRAENTDHVPVLPNILELFPDIEAHDNAAEQGPSCSLAEALGKQDLFINTLASTYAPQLLWTLFTQGRTQVQGAFFNLDDVRTVALPVKAWTPA
jgi:PRTRC genetic system ThiF family protein